ncbi:MAG: hypothetical protein WCF68_19390 [Terriglobales bacterium]
MLGFLTACGSSGSSAPAVVTVIITPSTTNIFVGKSQQFAANVYGSANTAVTWSVTEANGGTVSSAGNYTAPMTAGTYHVVATSVANPADSAAAPAVVTVPQPNFTSTPPMAASQDQPYSYTLAATDPAGTNVSYTLVTAPNGATLSGSTVSWTPSAQQARQDNAFAVKATSTAGGTATQSWAVAPTGTVEGSMLIMHWSADGTVGIEDNSVVAPIYSWAALVPQADGSLTVLPGTGYPDATWDVPGVPAGYYWMQFQPGDVVWTNASVFDYGSDSMGHMQLPLAYTFWGCDLTGLDPWDQVNDSLQLFSVNAQAFAATIEVEGIAPTPGSTICDLGPATSFGPTTIVGVMSGINGDITSTVQFEDSDALTFFDNALGIGPALNQPMTVLAAYPPPNGPPFLPATVSGALAITQPQSQDFTITFSAWENAFNAGGPVAAVPQAFEIEVNSQQQAAGLARTNPMLFGFSPNLAFAGADSNAAWPQDVNGNNTWPQDGDFGTLTFNNPFTTGMVATFDIVYIINATAQYSIPFPNSTVPVQLQATNTLWTPTLPTGFAPEIQPVGNPQVNGTSLFTATTVPTVSPTLTWTAPTSDAPVIYDISICQPVLSGTTATCNGVYYFGNYTQTTFTVPAGILTPGDSYIFAIESDSRTGFDPLHPNRYSLPEATAWLVSAAITVNSSAAPGVVHGNRSLLTTKPGQTKLPVSGLPVAGSSPVAGSKTVAKQTHFVSSHPLLVVRPQEQQSMTPNLQPAAKK